MLCGIHPSAVIGDMPEMRDWRNSYPRGWRSPDIHATAYVAAFCSVDGGTEQATTIGARSWLMKHVHVGHDAVIGEDCELAPGVVVGGHVEIGDRVRIGIGAVLRPFVKVGDGARIGAGAVIIRDVPEGVTVVGNPGRILVKRCGKDCSECQCPDGCCGCIARGLRADRSTVGPPIPKFEPQADDRRSGAEIAKTLPASVARAVMTPTELAEHRPDLVRPALGWPNPLADAQETVARREPWEMSR